MLPQTYNKMVENALSLVSDAFDSIGGSLEEGGGSINIYLKDVGEYLFNKQPASHQLWGSSPLSGPCRFDLVEDRWIHNKKGIGIEKYLEDEIKMVEKMKKDA